MDSYDSQVRAGLEKSAIWLSRFSFYRQVTVLFIPTCPMAKASVKLSAHQIIRSTVHVYPKICPGQAKFKALVQGQAGAGIPVLFLTLQGSSL